MCDDNTFADMDRAPQRIDTLTRRQFGTVTVGASVSVLLSGLAAAADDVAGRDGGIRTPDGKADGYLVHPVSGAHPGVLLWPDAFEHFIKVARDQTGLGTKS